MQHPLVRLAALIDWAEIERTFVVSLTSGRGRPALPPRLVAGLLYLQHTFNASDEAVVNSRCGCPRTTTLVVSGLEFWDRSAADLDCQLFRAAVAQQRRGDRPLTASSSQQSAVSSQQQADDEGGRWRAQFARRLCRRRVSRCAVATLSSDFSDAGMPPESSSAALPALRQLRTHPQRRKALLHLATHLLAYFGGGVPAVLATWRAPEGRQAYLQRVHSEHENICQAIRTQDADAARAAMRTHLSNSRERLRRTQDSSINSKQ